ncbi:MAG TPA: phosphatidylinositol-specific phospholipase C/glycerophosphodiester phosphodiesterase family protein [Candidatus Acidoferrum sp.]|nr:phosphatidylinositol-specific phospholipase C/glycerophosphodiester phosphodiesterase family protein [Candidatus Acidoferrum sp.]
MRLIPAFVLVLLGAFSVRAAAPLVRLHSHNDYEHVRPLADAMSHGFWSVEADVWLTNGQLLVAHDLANVSRNRTLQSLYLDPLRAFAATNASLFATAGPITLLVDVKSDGTNTWHALRDVFRGYTNLLTRFESNHIHTNAVIVIISGNRATQLIANESARYAAVDGRLPDLDANPPAALVPLVSDNWTKHFKWRGQGPISVDEREKLHALVARSHAQGRRIRLWAAPDSPAGWRELFDAEVDLVNTDRLAEAEKFLQNR